VSRGDESRDALSLVREGAEFYGVIRFQGPLRLDGCVRGSVRGTGALYLSKTALVVGPVAAHSLTLDGRVEGDVKVVDHVHLSAGSALRGSLRAASLRLEEGGELCADPLEIRPPTH